MNVLFVRLIFCFREGIADLRESTFRTESRNFGNKRLRDNR